MKVTVVFAVLLNATLPGCDEFLGPKIRSGYSIDVVVTVTYDDGFVTSSTWPSCRATFIGRPNRSILLVSVSVNGDVEHTYDSRAIVGLVQREALDREGHGVDFERRGNRLRGRDQVLQPA